MLGTAALTLIAGVDTTWSSIGSALWHLATHPDDRRRLVAEPELIPTAIEELLRAYSPVTMARIVAEDVEVGGCPMKAGDRVLLNFPAANRDPDAFADADEVVIDRAAEPPRRVRRSASTAAPAPTSPAWRCASRIEEWLAAIPDFRLDDGAEVTWAGGQVRGPRYRSRWSSAMKIRVDPDKCQGHNRCYAIAPDLFDVDDYGYADGRHDGDVPAGLEEKARLAVAQLPRARHRHHRPLRSDSRDTFGPRRPSAVRDGQDLQEVAAGIAPVHATTAVVVVDLVRAPEVRLRVVLDPRARRCGRRSGRSRPR